MESRLPQTASTPSAVQFVSVVDQLTSEVVTDNTRLLKKLSTYLDRESDVIKHWKHLAYVLDVPPEETRKFDMYTEHSPTEDLFNFLSDIWNPHLTVQELKMKLTELHRMDVVHSLETEFPDEMKVSDLISGEPKFIMLLSPKLDIESSTDIGNWRSLATEFGIRIEKIEQFGLRGSGPAGALFSYMRAAEGLCDLTMGQLLDHFQAMKRLDLVYMLEKQQPKIEADAFVLAFSIERNYGKHNQRQKKQNFMLHSR
ncbi:hypothetical protein OS493_005799 [Desmophyllum pertusum]|uniref:Death domain-containing protein n=1 Tax=Desmophyllum pertusum TaxID=174260 RepID=A0A9W9YGX9_9CNID|nr:hypothetical protein OS493_005799 [Desmophyllum pertusum]